MKQQQKQLQRDPKVGRPNPRKSEGQEVWVPKVGGVFP